MDPSQQQPKPSSHDVMDTTSPSDAASPDDHHYHSYILIDNPKKSNNLGPILRCAAAFAVSRVVLIGYDKCSTDGSHGAAKHVPSIAFPTFDQGVAYLKEECNVVNTIGVLGCYEEGNSDETVITGLNKDEDLVVPMSKEEVECDNNETNKRFFTKLYKQQQKEEYVTSWPVHKRLFAKQGNTSFIISKNWRGLPLEHASYCNSFVHIPLHSDIRIDDHNNEQQQHLAPFQLLDVQSCLSMTLHHYTAWAKYHERSFDGQKFEVIKKDAMSSNRNEQQMESARKRARIREEAVENESFLDGGIFGGDTKMSGDY